MKSNKLFFALASALSLLCISPNVLAQNRCAKVVVIGDYGSGKTSIFKQIIDEEYRAGDELQTKDYRQEDIIERVEQDNLHIKIWDTPGLKEYRTEVIDKTDGSDMVYFVIDITKKYDEHMQKYLDDMYKTISGRNPSCNIVFLLTKYDIRKNFPVNVTENIKTMEALKIGLDNEYFFTSSKNNFECQKQNFIHAKTLKLHMIEYLKTHINKLPNKHESTRVPSKFEIDSREDNIKKQQETIDEQQETINEQKEEIKQLKDKGDCVIL